MAILFGCDLCPNVVFYSAKHQIRRHIESFHLGMGNIKCYADNGQDNEFSCKRCKSMFTSKSQLKKHVKKVHKKLTLFTCAVCCISLKSRRLLQNHENEFHQNVREHRCPTCNALVSSIKAMREHLTNAHRKHELACKECGCKVSSVSRMIIHINTFHKNMEPIQCSECSATFLNNYIMRQHLDQVHNKLRPFPCSSCPSTFVSKNNLETHVKWVHEQVIRFACKECGLAFSTKGNMNAHCLRVHGNFKPYKCSACSAAYSLKRDLQNHFKKVHDVRSFACKVCGKNFAVRGDSEGMHLHMCFVPPPGSPFFGNTRISPDVLSAMGKMTYTCIKCNFQTIEKTVSESHCQDCRSEAQNGEQQERKLTSMDSNLVKSGNLPAQADDVGETFIKIEPIDEDEIVEIHPVLTDNLSSVVKMECLSPAESKELL